MGYYNNVTQWSKGEYADANNTQDDVAIISGQLGYRSDDHGNSPGSATALQVDADGIVAVTFPEIDPYNQDPANKGVIETRSDVDLFWFDTAEGYVTFNLLPAWKLSTATAGAAPISISRPNFMTLWATPWPAAT
ncbi:hypothetical protein [Marinobacterium aestuariivivens]|uniref:Uncharacterized protein n=1 Tax=Marinobacterium aestuariivivens TaxID=1698799 RepID=A0ABW2A6Z0_9GAMM